MWYYILIKIIIKNRLIYKYRFKGDDIIMKKILIADDEARMRKLVGDFLKKEGYEIIEAEDGKKALEIFFQEGDISLVILDVMMPECDGWAVCRKIKQESNVPVIMLTARDEESDEIFGFELGADEYIKKPFSPKILTSRVNVIMRRNREPDNIKFMDVEIDEIAHTVTIAGELKEMTPKEYELLIYFIKNKGIMLSREQILNNVWGYNYFGDERTVDTHVKKLREKLGERAETIKTIRGYGYKMEMVK